MLFWSRLIIPQPEPPPPNLGLDPILQGPEGEPLDIDDFCARTADSDIVVDGSATQGVFREVNRSSYAAVFLAPGDEYSLVARALGTVWPGLPQTPQSGEQLGLATLSCLATGHSHAHSDCLGAVRLHNLRPSAQLDLSQVFAGLRRRALAEEGMASLISVSHTPAHRSDAVIAALPPRERKIALGNQDADRLAKHALTLHPSLPPAELEELDATVGTIRKLVSMFAAVLSVFPKLVFRRDPTGPRPKTLRAHQWHDWVTLDSDEPSDETVSRCSKCFQVAYGEERPMLGCKGLSTALQHLHGAESERGHLLCATILQEADCQPLVFCFRCGAYTSKRCFKLGGLCDGRPGSSGRSALHLIRQGRYPHYRSGVAVDAGNGGTTCRATAGVVLREAARPSASSASSCRLIPTEGMTALAARIRAREEAAKMVE